MENTADTLIVIGRGKLIAQSTVAEFIAANSQQSVRVVTPDISALTALVTAAGATVRDDRDGKLVVLGLTPAQVGDLAFEHRIRLHELAPAHASLEQAFMELTASSVEFQAGLPASPEPASPDADALTAGRVG
jgi:ABC-2 type transport system ATP-binding protein